MDRKLKGQIRLEVKVSGGHLNVHVKQARQLSTKRAERCCAFVKVCLSPDAYKKSNCQTDTVTDTNQPTFNEKFSFELLPEDLKKRLLISVWHIDPNTQFVELLGCTSFGLWHITSNKKTINGWYYLLCESLGKSKHLQVSTNSVLQTPTSHQHKNHQPTSHLATTNPPECCCRKSQQHGDTTDEPKYEAFVFVIRRGVPDGFGFGILGSAPVTVSRVDRGSPADSAGLKPGDHITHINSLNVDQSSAQTVARIIKNSGKKLILEVNRSILPEIPLTELSHYLSEGVDCPVHPPHSSHTPLITPHKEDDYVDMSNWRMTRFLKDDDFYSTPRSTPVKSFATDCDHEYRIASERIKPLQPDPECVVCAQESESHLVDVDLTECSYERLSSIQGPSQNYNIGETLSQGSSQKLSSMDEGLRRSIETDKISAGSERALIKNVGKKMSVGMCVGARSRKVRFCVSDNFR